MTDPNGSRRQLDGVILQRLDKIEAKIDNYLIETERRITKLETYATLRGVVGGAISTALLALSGVLVWLWKG